METGVEYQGDNSALTYKSKFSYDRFGNRFRKSADNATGSPTANWVGDSQIDPATNRFVNSTTSITYDEAGNVTADPKFRSLQYKYDANGRMIWSATASNTQQADAVYDGQGQRVATQVGGVWRYMVYDVYGKMIAEYGGADSTNAGGVHYQISDHQGSVRAVTNENGWIAGRHDYQPFGEELSAGSGQRTVEQGYNAPDTSRQKYALTERDEATGLDHTAWRKYEQNAGRWTSPDPCKGSMNRSDPQSMNRFVYSGNDPVNYVDPSGLYWRTSQTCSIYEGQIECGDPIRFWVDTNTPYMAPHGSNGGGGGGATNSSQPSDCLNFVDYLVMQAYGALHGSEWATGIERGDDASTGKWAVGHGDKRYGGTKEGLPYSGFKYLFTGPDQAGDVYKHVAGLAGATLIGKRWIKPWGGKVYTQGGTRWARTGIRLAQSQLWEDEDQAHANDAHSPEAVVEVHDDWAGIEIGNLMKQVSSGNLSLNDFRNQVFNKLCSY